MRPAVRYCITAGVALGGISVLIAAPSSPPLRDVEVPAMQLSDNTHDNLGREQPLRRRTCCRSWAVRRARWWCRTSPSPTRGVLEGGQPANVPGLSDLLNLGNDPAVAHRTRRGSRSSTSGRCCRATSAWRRPVPPAGG